MKQLFQKFLGALLICTLVLTQSASAQVMNPNDPVVEYTGGNLQQPAWGQVGDWVKTTRLNWNTDDYKCYIFQGHIFRLKFPKTYQHNVNDGKTYPLFIFFHGLGEAGDENMYDNEYQLFHGGELHKNAVNDGEFDGFLLYMQNQYGFFGNAHFDALADLINNFLVPQNKVDINRIMVNGLSGGGTASWDMAIRHPRLIAGTLPISAANALYQQTANLNILRFINIWHFQGGRDNNPAPATSHNLGNALLNAGANYRYTEYPNRGHSCWYDAWNEDEYFSWMSSLHKANPIPLGRKYEFCEGESPNVTLGITPGFDGYQWMKDGVVIPGATSNTYQVTQFGTYAARIRRGTQWSVWSPTPIVVKIKDPTIPPDINPIAGMSPVIPAPDGNNSVTLEEPEGFLTYSWQRVGNPQVLSTARTFSTSTPGDYVVKVTEEFGCLSEFSAPFKVVDANGPNKPDPATNVVVSTLSTTSLKLDWMENPYPEHNETAFEVFQATAAGGPYKYVGKTDADVNTFTVNGLDPGIRYFYIVRAVNNTGAATPSDEASGLTTPDNTAPTAPGGLMVTSTTSNSVGLAWEHSTDVGLGVAKYDIYINGVKSYVTDDNEYTCYNLSSDQYYNFIVKARDLAGNVSVPSNQVSGYTVNTGINMKVYLGSWTQLPNFSTLTPLAEGRTSSVTLSGTGIPGSLDGFGVLYEGFLYIPASGTYTLRLRSDDGSRLWLAPYNFNTPSLIDNDGDHSAQDRDATIFLEEGAYPLTVAYFNRTGSNTLQLSWRVPGSTSFVTIPSMFYRGDLPPTAQIPIAPTNLSATPVSHKQINLTWADNSVTETAFELERSTDSLNGYVKIAEIAPNTTSYNDSTLAPNTLYYYRIRAINTQGASAYDRDGAGIGYSYYEASGMAQIPNFNLLTSEKSGRVATIGIEERETSNNFAFRFHGFITVPTNGNYTFYTTSKDGSRLYIGTQNAAGLVVDNDGVHGTQERSGSINLTAGTHPIFVTYFEGSGNGENLSVSYSGPGIAKQLIPHSVLGKIPVKATTFALPTVPATPAGLVANGINTSSIAVTWTDNSNDETGFELYRSNEDNGNYIKIADLPANTSSYTDEDLYASSIFYYKVLALNFGGNSGYSNEDSASSKGYLPVMASVENQYMRYGTQLDLPIAPTYNGNGSPSLVVSNLPAFASFTDNGNGTGTISFQPTIAQMGTYPNILVEASNGNSGVASTSFQLVVSDNHNPVAGAVSNVTLNENQTAQLVINASDADAGDVLSWSFTGLPSFATATPGSGSVTIDLEPGYAHSGAYSVLARVQDQENGFDTTRFTITVNEVNPNNKIYVNFNDGSLNGASPWNNTARQPSNSNGNFPSLKDQTGATTSVGLQVVSPWQNMGNGSNNLGVNTGNNTGVYPDNVMRSAWWSDVTAQQVRIYGLDVNSRYNITFFGSRGSVTNNRTSTYSINGNTVSLNAAGNSQNTVKLDALVPQPDGTLLLTVDNGSGSSFSYLNAMVIESVYDDGSVPATPTNLTAQLLNGKPALSWTDVAYNETAYEVYRSTSENGSYTLLNAGGNNADLDNYADENISGNITYYYKVRASNVYGNSEYSNIASIKTNNGTPVLSEIAEVKMKTQQVININLTVADDAGDIITLQAENLPSFATLNDNGNGTGVISIVPGSTIGIFDNITITARDDKGATHSREFKITVTDKDITSIYVNFNAIVLPLDPYWNSMNSVGYGGKTISNLKDEAENTTTVGVTLVDAWEGANDLGATTGNNSGVFPDNVMKTVYYESSTNVKRIRVTGLSSTHKYNLVFFASRSASDNRSTTYSAGGQSVTLNAANNTTNTVQINGLVPDASGVIEFTAQRGPGSPFAYFGALVIQSYVDNGTPIAPSNLTAEAKSKTSVELNWSDKSGNEDGFEIYRSTSYNGTYSLIHTTAANITTYTDNTANGSTVYYYKVRGKRAPFFFSSYSNIAGTSAYTFSVYVNFNRRDGAPTPWNNTNRAPELGRRFRNLNNDLNNDTGLDMEITENFSGDNPSGMITGDNSGVFPDNVIRSSWWVDFGLKSQLKISGLNQNWAYTFIFFGSRNGGGDRTSVYTINGQSVSLNASFNISETVQIDKVRPDENGEVFIDISLGQYAQYAYLGAMVIHGYQVTDGDGSSSNGRMATQNFTTQTGRSTPNGQPGQAADKSHPENSEMNITGLSAYPNPITDQVTVSVNFEEAQPDLTVRVIDVAGKTVVSKYIGNVPAGYWSQRLSLPEDQLKPGIYLLQLYSSKSKTPVNFKLVKTK